MADAAACGVEQAAPRRGDPTLSDGGQAARRVARRLLAAVLDRGHAFDDAEDHDPELPKLEARDRGFVRVLALTVLRRLGQIDALIDHCLAKPLPAKSAPTLHALRLGIAQLLFLGTPAHAAVDTAVGLVREAALRGLVNAVLRRVARDGEGLIDQQDEARLNLPDWLWDSWVAAHGEAATRMAAAVQQAEPPLDLTVKGDPAPWVAPLGATLLPTGTLRRPVGGAITDLPGFAEGAWWVQDAAAALPARLLGDVAGRAVADLCAAPGGKTAQLAAAGAHVTAIESSLPRARRLRENLDRLKLTASVVEADAATWRPQAPFDAVLLDAPCSATGTLRRHPDIAHLRGPEDVARLIALQDRMLDHAWTLLAPGGTLVYAVCSLQPEEGPGRIARLLEGGAPLDRRPLGRGELPGLAGAVTAAGDLLTLPGMWAEQGGMDGFYACRLARRA